MSGQLKLWDDGEERDSLRWSVSRHRRLESCPRKYYLFHYGSRGGHLPDASRALRELVVLRGLRTRKMWVGEVVHSIIELAMGAWRRGEQAPVEGLVSRLVAMMRAQYAQSLQRFYWDRPMQAVGLIEHEYGEPVSPEEWRRERDHAEACVRTFYDLPVVQEIRDTPRWRWLAVETGGTFKVAGASVMARPDVAFRDDAGRIVVVDWKTGIPRPVDEDLQLGVYGIYAQRSWGLQGEPLRAVNAYLKTGDVRERLVAEDELRATQATVETSVRAMRSLTPRAPSASPGPADQAAFPLTGDTGTCGRCGFKRICQRE